MAEKAASVLLDNKGAEIQLDAWYKEYTWTTTDPKTASMATLQVWNHALKASATKSWLVTFTYNGTAQLVSETGPVPQ